MKNNSKRLKILTYNIFLRPPPIKTNQDDYKNERLQDILNQMHNFDVICFQELFQTCSFRKEKVIQTAISKGFFYWKGCQPPAFWDGPPVDSGLLVVSKYPIVQSKFESYKVGILSDSASDKGYIYCKINVKGKIMHLFTTHLQASYLHPGMLEQRQLSIRCRIQQFRKLMKVMRQLLQAHSKNIDEELVMLVGDLNMNALMLPQQIKAEKSVLFYEQQRNGQHQFYQYTSFQRIFQDFEVKALDCALQYYKFHPVTFGDGDVVLTDKLQSQSKQRLDFIFKLDVASLKQKNKDNNVNFKPADSSTQKCLQTSFQINQNRKKKKSLKKKLQPILSSTKVQKFLVQNKKYTQLSDHYGMSIEIEIPKQ